jgi:hypothetical protein
MVDYLQWVYCVGEVLAFFRDKPFSASHSSAPVFPHSYSLAQDDNLSFVPSSQEQKFNMTGSQNLSKEGILLIQVFVATI